MLGNVWFNVLLQAWLWNYRSFQVGADLSSNEFWPAARTGTASPFARRRNQLPPHIN